MAVRRRGPLGGGSYRLRPVGAADVPVLVRHRERMFSDLDQWDVVDPAALREVARAYRPWLLARLRAGKLAGFLAETAQGAALGSALVHLREAPPRPRWTRGELPYVMNVYTVPEARGRGVATGLLEEILHWCRARGFPRVTLNASDMGRGVYERLGFETGSEMRLQFVPLHPPETAIGRPPGGRRRGAHRSPPGRRPPTPSRRGSAGRARAPARRNARRRP